MDNLPVQILSDIFSRLPADAVLNCRQVCKLWRNLLSLDKTNFDAMHFSRHNHRSSKVTTTTQGLIFFVRATKKNKGNIMCHRLYYGEHNDDIMNKNKQCIIQHKLRLINHPLQNRWKFTRNSSFLVGSCNGLICLGDLEGYLKDPTIICNPITGEYSRLEESNDDYIDVGRVISIYSGFGYIPRTDEYKVVRILYSYDSKTAATQVYTLGAGSGWRNKEVITDSFGSTHGVFANGAIHWLGNNKKDIMVFNLSDEKFHVLPIHVPFSGHTYQFTHIFGSTEQGLFVSGCEDVYFSKYLDIWTYKKSTAINNKEETWSWCKEFSMDLGKSDATHYKPLAVTNSGFVLFKYKDLDNPHISNPYGYTLFCYDSKTATTRTLGIWKDFKVIPHTNSFVSLKALGEKTCKERK